MWMKLIFLEAVPYVTIIVLNALIIRQILQSYQFRKTFRTANRFDLLNMFHNKYLGTGSAF